MDAPERIWLQDAGNYEVAKQAMGDLTWCSEPIDDADTEYVRADKAEALASDLQAKLTDCCLQALATDGQAFEALERAEKAEALLAEAVEALTAVQAAYDGQGVNRKEMDIVRATLAKIKEAKDA